MKEQESDARIPDDKVGQAVLIVQKYVIGYSFFAGKQPTENIIVTKPKNEESEPFKFYIKFWNMGPSSIKEIVFVDALPKNFELNKLCYYSDGRSNIWQSDFDDMVWEIKENKGVKFLIVRFIMNRRPFKPNEKFTISLNGKLFFVKRNT